MPWDDDKNDPWGNPGKKDGGKKSGGQKNNGPKGQGPWGQPPKGSNNNTPPEIDELIRQSQQKIKENIPGGFGPLGMTLIAVLVFFGWLATGIYQINPGEQGVVLRFGEPVGTSTPGINYHLPYPIETVEKVNVLEVRQVNLGAAVRGRADTSLMLTGDENIVDVNFTVFWNIQPDGATKYLFNIQDPQGTVRVVAESAIREVVGRSNLQPILTGERQKTEEAVKDLIQTSLDSYNSGVQVTQVQLQKVEAPAQVIEAFNDVQAARIDQERMINEANAYRNEVIPRARGNAEQIIQRAEAYKEATVSQAKGEAERFLSIYEEYAKAPEVTRNRIYIETMERVYSGSNKIILDSENNGVLPYLPLNGLNNNTSTGAK